MNDDIFGSWIEPCRSIGCTWIEERDVEKRGSWLWHQGPDESEINPEHRMLVLDKIRGEWGGAQKMVFEFFAAHHRDPLLVDFDEERERARLVAV